MSLEAFENYFLQQPEPNRSCLIALKAIILDFEDQLKPAWKYKMPFFCYRNKMFCYLWIEKSSGWPYLGVVEGKRVHHPALSMGNRSRMKSLLVDPNIDLPIETIKEILEASVLVYQEKYG